MNKSEICERLEQVDSDALFQHADAVRKREFGDVVHIRAIIEYGNYCKRRCAYCGLNAGVTDLERYRMTDDAIVETAKKAADAGYQTVVLQGGEDPYFDAESLGRIVRAVKKTGLAVTLSAGEMRLSDYAYLKECGADRYLLKHETANAALYGRLHPDATLNRRIECLKTIKRLGYETGSGFMIGLPGQTTQDIAEDLLLLAEIGCDMAGIGPFIPSPNTPLAHAKPGSTETTERAVALARIMMPRILLPATTSLDVLGGGARSVFDCGANVVMRKVTPTKERNLYRIYPSAETVTDIRRERTELESKIIRAGRIPL